MLIAAASLAVAFAVSAAAAAPAAPVPPVPPLLVTVLAAPDIPPRLVRGVLAEAEAVWRAAGLTFLWHFEAARPQSDAGTGPPRAPGFGRATPPYGLPSLRVIVGHEARDARAQEVPLGWIVFDDPRTPEKEIYVSYRNAVTLLERSSPIVGTPQAMPMLKRELLLARAMGRALAHELGHYLSASKMHTAKGLMMAVHSAAEFFGTDLRRFTLEPVEVQRIAARFMSIPVAGLRGGHMS
jgi:hypothetical protein